MKKIITGMLVSIGLIGVLQFTTPLVSAQFNAAKNEACEGLSAGDDFIDCSSGQQSSGIKGILATTLNILSIVAGVIAVIMIIIAGIKFMTSQGDAAKIASARSTVIYAIIGLIIVALSQTIVFFVLREASRSPAPATEDATVIQSTS